MKQVIQNLRSGETSVIEVPIPQPKPGEALVHNAFSLVSAGTERMIVEFAGKSLLGKARSRPDLAKQVIDKARREGLLTTLDAAFNRLDQPMPLGYSSAGTIVALGEQMGGYSIGQRVACSGGGYALHAEYVRVPFNLLTPLPEEVTPEQAAFTTLGAIALHGFRLTETGLGERVAVIGLGLLGLLAIQIVNAAGCHVLGIDLDASRVALAKELGANAVGRDDAESVSNGFTYGQGFDSVLICADTSSADPVELAGSIARDRARVVAVGAVGLQLPRRIYYEKELTFINSRSYGPGRYDPSYEEDGRDYPIGYVRWTEGRNLEAFVDLLAQGKVDVAPLISHHFSIDQAERAYQLISGDVDQAYLGVLLTYPQEASEGAELLSQEKDNRIESHPDIPAIPYSTGKKIDLIRLGVLGAGNFALAVMLPTINKISDIKLVGIASTSGTSAAHAAQRFGFQYACSQDDRILDDPEINTVAILTRHGLHAQQVIAGLKAGKNVFCEKPLAINREELDEIEKTMQTLAGEDALPALSVGFNRRFAPLAQKMRQFLDSRSEPLVAQYRINAGYLPLNHWTQDPNQGGGRIIGEGCHFIDFLTFLVGEAPIAVQAMGLPDMGRYREDNVISNFRFSDGSLGTLTYLANGDKSFPKERVEVFCAGSVLVLNDFRSLEAYRDGKRKVYHSRLHQDKGHEGEWKAFRDTLLNGAPLPISYEQIFGVTRATFAAVAALRYKGEVMV